MNNIREQYNTIVATVTGEITEKRSRFIATAFHVGSEEEANTLIAETKKKFWDARHNCYAYITGIDNEISRFSDDGEPGGTAGRPILDVLKNRGLTNTLVVVTRYFGGVLLGTGGLVRAYTDSTLAALDNAAAQGSLVTMCYMQDIKIKTDYNLSGKVQYILSGEEKVSINDIRYEADVEFAVGVQTGYTGGLVDKITDVTNGRAVIDMGECGYYPLTNRLT